MPRDSTVSARSLFLYHKRFLPHKKDHIFMILIEIDFQKSELGANLDILFFDFIETFRSLFPNSLTVILGL